MINFILNSSNILIVFLGMLVSVFLSFLFYQYGKIVNTKKIAFTCESFNLVTEYNKNLKIVFNDKIVRTLTSSTITITNIGNKCITPADFAPSSPLMITSTQGFLFDEASQCNISAKNDMNIVSLIRIDDHCLLINFEFLNPKDKISLSLLHMGDISITGCIKDGFIKDKSNKISPI